MKYLKEYIDFNDFEWEEEDPDMVDIPSGESLEFYKRYIGRKVMIKPSSQYHRGTERNPKDVIGTVIYLNNSVHKFIFRVRWDATHTNNYRPEDLVLVD